MRKWRVFYVAADGLDTHVDIEAPSAIDAIDQVRIEFGPDKRLLGEVLDAQEIDEHGYEIRTCLNCGLRRGHSAPDECDHCGGSLTVKR